MACKICKTTRFMEFECVACCLRWLGGMDSETQKLNAPVIKFAVSEQHLDAVREAWKRQPKDKS